MLVRRASLRCLLAAVALAAAPAQSQPRAYLAARILPVSAPPIDGGVLLVRDGRIAAIGARREVALPPGCEVVDLGDQLIAPGFVDIHHHVSGGDINDMVQPLNPELRTLDVVRPSSLAIRETLSGGVTTTLFLPGSGTYLGGFGVLLKMRWNEPLERMVLRPLGAMKVAQGYNPERSSGDLGASRMGSQYLLDDLLRRGQRYAAAWHAFDQGQGPKPELQPELEQLRQVFDLQVPVLIHTAGARDCVATARMFQDVFHLRMILSHGSFDGWWAAAAVSRRHTPVNLGPRMYQFDRYSRMQGMCQAYWDEGCRDMSINTDAPVVAADQLPLQAAMAVRLGLAYETALQAVTLVPARQIGIDDRVGSLAVGKDADFLVAGGDPLDPRWPPRQVYIDGQLVYRQGDVK